MRRAQSTQEEERVWTVNRQKRKPGNTAGGRRRICGWAGLLQRGYGTSVNAGGDLRVNTPLQVRRPPQPRTSASSWAERGAGTLDNPTAHCPVSKDRSPLEEPRTRNIGTVKGVVSQQTSCCRHPANCVVVTSPMLLPMCAYVCACACV